MKRLQFQKAKADAFWNKVFKDTLNGKINVIALGMSMEQCIRADWELIKFQYKELDG